jgi:hypothetical protein
VKNKALRHDRKGKGALTWEHRTLPRRGICGRSYEGDIKGHESTRK